MHFPADPLSRTINHRQDPLQFITNIQNNLIQRDYVFTGEEGYVT